MITKQTIVDSENKLSNVTTKIKHLHKLLEIQLKKREYTNKDIDELLEYFLSIEQYDICELIKKNISQNKITYI